MNNIVYHYSFQDSLYKWQTLLPIEKHENTYFKYIYLIENQISNTYLITLIISILNHFACC